MRRVKNEKREGIEDENDEKKWERREVNLEKAAVQHLSCQLVLKFRQKQQRTRGAEQVISGRIVFFFSPSPTMIKNILSSGFISLGCLFFPFTSILYIHDKEHTYSTICWSYCTALGPKGRIWNSKEQVEELITVISLRRRVEERAESQESRVSTLTTTWAQTTEFKWNDKQRGAAALGEKTWCEWAEPAGAERDRQQAALH